MISRHHLRALLPPVVLGLILSSVFILPRQEKLMESSISPELPVGIALPGWHGTKIQETDIERATLAADTRFSKARYNRRGLGFMDKQTPPVEVSIVYSGNDMNSSIHRPERCMPSQGHIDLRTSSSRITLKNGQALSVTRLTSRVDLPRGAQADKAYFVGYYVFVGHGTMRHTHIGRTLQDMYDRVANGYVQRWAYLHISSYWAPEFNTTEEETDRLVRDLISDLLPGLINWQEM